jgi:NADPH oxidase 5
MTKGDGLIQFYELEHVMRACMEENGLKFSDEQINKLTVALFEDADQGNKGTITFEALKKQLEKREGLLENLSIRLEKLYKNWKSKGLRTFYMKKMA